MPQFIVYTVYTRQIWVQPIEVLALSIDDAIQRVVNGEGIMMNGHIEACMDVDTWIVKTIPYSGREH